MKQTVKPGALIAAWDAQSLYDKAVRYMQQCEGVPNDEWEYGLWSSLALELLARAALANINPVLLAEPDKAGANLISALGFEPVENKFQPKSIVLTEALRRLTAMLPGFLQEHESFCALHTARRNAELHSGELGFDGVRGSSWQPRFYQTCEVLLASLGKTLEDFVGLDEAKAAKIVIASAVDESAKAVKGDVSAHRKVWEAKSEEERAKLAGHAQLWATRQTGHRVDCPACKSEALVVGSPVSAVVRQLKEDQIIERQDYLPNQFECVACGLKITGLSRLAVVELSDRYTKTETYDAAAFYAPDEEDYFGFEDDNNE